MVDGAHEELECEEDFLFVFVEYDLVLLVLFREFQEVADFFLEVSLERKRAVFLLLHL